MIARLRWKFIAITMAAVFAVLLLIVAAVNAVNIWQSNAALDSVTALLLDSGGTFQKLIDAGMDGEKPDRPGDKKLRPGETDRFHEKELPFATRFFTVTLDEDGSVSSCDLSSIASVTGDEAAEIAAAILARGAATGWYQSYRYRLGETPDGLLVIAVEATSTRSAIRSVLLITLTVALAALCAILALIVPLSRRVIGPIAETYEKQRQFITDASHELKTPLTVISANAELLGMTCGESEWTDGILRQCEHMRSLVGKMVQMSRLDEGELHLTFEDFDLGEAVYDTAMSFQGPAGSRGLTLTVDAPSGIGFRGDEGALRQLTSILVDNALKYCDDGGRIDVSLAREGHGFGRDRLVLSVRNTYSAVAQLETDKLFERFYRADPAHSAGSSFGLGLPIARSVAEKHGGSLTAKKLPPDAVEFTASLPVRGG